MSKDKKASPNFDDDDRESSRARKSTIGKPEKKVADADAIAGEGEQNEATDKIDLPGMVEGKLIDVPGMEVLNLASELFTITSHAVLQATALKLSHFQATTFLGAKALTGQLLNRSDSSGSICLGRYVQEHLTKAALHSHPTLPPPIPKEEANLPVSIPEPEAGLDPTAELRMDLLGLPNDLVQGVFRSEPLEVDEWLQMIYSEIRIVRGGIEWMKSLHDFKRKVLQGAQITAAQLLGLTDRFGPVTLARYVNVGVSDFRILNAIGYNYRVSRPGPVKTTSAAIQP